MKVANPGKRKSYTAPMTKSSYNTAPLQPSPPHAKHHGDVVTKMKGKAGC